jgi:ABC-type Fe3+ transport system substrate-binding protein
MINRRRLLQSAAALGATGFPALAAPPARLTVMTSYPQEVISRYVDAFGKRYPHTQVDVVWKSGDDARDYLLGDGKDKVDVYWTPSVRSFFELKKRNLLHHLDFDRTGLPGRIGKQMISDPDGYFEATEIAGYGLLLNPAYLAQHNLPEPKDWKDLTKPVYSGHVTMPVPSRVGFAPTITEIILQGYGWKAGWATLTGIAGNATLLFGRGDGPIGAVSKGDKGIAMTIDFLASQALVRGAPLKFVYPEVNAFEPANIGMLAGAPNPKAAMDYIRFVLSDAGQTLLIDPDVRRLAIRPATYKHAPKDFFNPWAASVTKQLSFDDATFVARRDLDNALFDAVIFDPRDRRAALWATIHELEPQKGLPAAATAALFDARAKLTAVPIDEAAAAKLADAFQGYRRDGDPSPTMAGPEGEWKAWSTATLDAAAVALAQAQEAAKRAG